jgi:hypothetical protein
MNQLAVNRLIEKGVGFSEVAVYKLKLSFMFAAVLVGFCEHGKKLLDLIKCG